MFSKKNSGTVSKSVEHHKYNPHKLLDAVRKEAESAKEEFSEVQIEQAENLFHWRAPEFIKHQKTTSWYMAAGLIAVIFSVWALLTGNWTLAIAILVFAGVYEYTQRFHPPKVVDVRISELGIHVGHLFYPYSSIQAFWIMYKPGLKTLNLRVHRQFYSDVIIQMMDTDPAQIRSYLVGQIPEWEGKEERLQDHVLRLLKL